jgi:hypothetical protein
LATSKLKGSHSDAKETTPALGPKLTVKNNPFGVLSPWKETEFLACFCLCFLVTHVGPSLTGSEMWVPSVLGAPELDFGSSSLASELPLIPGDQDFHQNLRGPRSLQSHGYIA